MSDLVKRYDEIVALRGEINRLRAENAKLRYALRRIAEELPDHYIFWAKDIAHAALNETADSSGWDGHDYIEPKAR